MVHNVREEMRDPSSEQMPEHSAGNTTGKITREFLGRLRDIILRYGRLSNRPGKRTVSPSEAEREQSPRKKRGRILYLMILPWLLLAGFLSSFFWDFPDRSLLLFGQVYPFEGILRIVSISGLIGFLTNWIAITMLFRPTENRPVFGQGLLPTQKARVADRLAKAVSEDMINPEIIKSKIKESGIVRRYSKQSSLYLKDLTAQPEFRKEIKSWIIEYTETLMAQTDLRKRVTDKIYSELEHSFEDKTFEKAAFKAYTYLRGTEARNIIEKSVERIPESIQNELDLLDQIMDSLPRQLEKESERIEKLATFLLNRLINQLDVYTIVEENLKKYDHNRLEHMIKRASNDQLDYIKYLGALLGMIGGLVIWQPIISLIGLGLLFLTLILLDSGLFFLRKSSMQGE